MEPNTGYADVGMAELLRTAAEELATAHSALGLRQVQFRAHALQYTLTDESLRLLCFFLETYVHDVGYNLCADFPYTKTSALIRRSFFEEIAGTLSVLAAKLDGSPGGDYWTEFAHLIAAYLRAVKELASATPAKPTDGEPACP